MVVEGGRGASSGGREEGQESTVPRVSGIRICLGIPPCSPHDNLINFPSLLTPNSFRFLFFSFPTVNPENGDRFLGASSVSLLCVLFCFFPFFAFVARLVWFGLYRTRVNRTYIN